MLNKSCYQQGITLIEVLVGFVIFTSSLVAILNYISGQVYHSHLAANNLHKVELIYDLSSAYKIDLDQRLPVRVSDESLDLNIVTTPLDSFTYRKNSIQLNQITYSISEGEKSLDWAVIKFN